MATTNTLTPFTAIHAGEFLKDELSARQMKQSELASLTGIKTPILNDIIKGKRGITPEYSCLIGNALGIDSRFFYNMQVQYDMDVAAISERVASQCAAIEIWEVIKNYISETFFIFVGELKRNMNVKEKVEKVFDIFKVKTLDDFLLLKNLYANTVCYRQSQRLIADETDIFSWTYYSKYNALKESISNTFERTSIPMLCAKLNGLFYENTNTLNKIKKTLNEYGIKFLVQEKQGQIPLDGMSYMEGATPVIVLTLRHKQLDRIAFSLFHELGHIYTHLIKDSANMMLNVGEKDIKEKEADKFATDMLISPQIWRDFSNATYRVSRYQIEPYITSFSNEYKIHKSILSGRYMHEIDNFKLRIKTDNILH